MKVLALIGCALQVAEGVEFGGDSIAEGLGIGIGREHERGIEDESKLIAVFPEGAAVEFDRIAGEELRVEVLVGEGDRQAEDAKGTGEDGDDGAVNGDVLSVVDAGDVVSFGVVLADEFDGGADEGDEELPATGAFFLFEDPVNDDVGGDGGDDQAGECDSDDFGHEGFPRRR